LPDVIRLSFDAKTTTGSISQVTAFSLTGSRSTLTGEIFRSRVNLPSTWIFDRNELAQILTGKVRVLELQEILVPPGLG
jgi:hypothetical protein